MIYNIYVSGKYTKATSAAFFGLTAFCATASAFFPICLGTAAPNDFPLIKSAGFNCVALDENSPMSASAESLSYAAKQSGLKLIMPQAAAGEKPGKAVWAVYGKGKSSHETVAKTPNALAAFPLLKDYDYILLTPLKTEGGLACAKESGLTAGTLEISKGIRAKRVFCRLPEADFSRPADFPSFEELRFAAWSAAASGASGIFYGPAGEPTRAGDLLASAAKVNAELAGMAGIISGKRAAPAFKVQSELRVAAWKHGGKTYTALINTAEQPQPAPTEIFATGKYRPLYEKSRSLENCLPETQGAYFLPGHRVLLLES